MSATVSSEPSNAATPGVGPADLTERRYVRGVDGGPVVEGQVTDETTLAKLWRWPAQFLPDFVIQSSTAPLVVAAFPFLFWGGLGWIVWKGLKKA